MGLRLALVVALVALVVWEYTPALRGGFVYEDATWTDGCETVAGAPVRGFTWVRSAMRESWCWQVAHRQSALAFHLVSLGLHLVVMSLVLALVWSFTGHAIATGLAAAFFGLNAMGVESVAYLSSRGELVAAIGVLGACLAALHRRWLLVGLLAALGMAGKETAAVVVMLVPLCLWYQRGRGWGWVAALGGVGLGFVIRHETWYWWSLWHARPLPWALLQSTAMARVLALSVLPFGQTVDYDYARVPMVLEWFAASFLLAGVLWALVQRHRLRVCGVAWIACAVAPRLLVPTPASVLSEHQFYLPLVGVALILASLLTQEPRDHYRPAL